MLGWNQVDDILFPLNLSNTHWVLCALHLQEWFIDIYDCDQYVFRKRSFDKILAPISKMLPYLFDRAMSDLEKAKFPKMNIQPIPYNRVPHTEVPRTKRSGDCGVYTIMYLEYLTSCLNMSNVIDEHMDFWRRKWAVRLFHRIIDP